MKYNDLLKKANDKIVSLLKEGYVIATGDSGMGYELRVELFDSYENPSKVISVRIENEYRSYSESEADQFYNFSIITFDYEKNLTYFEGNASEVKTETYASLGNLLYEENEFKKMNKEIRSKRLERFSNRHHANTSKTFTMGKLNENGFKRGMNLVTPKVTRNGKKFYEIYNQSTGKTMEISYDWGKQVK